MAGNSSSRGIAGGIILIGLGALFLFARLTGVSLTANLVPYLVIGAGLLFFAGMLARGRGAGGLAIPGSIITTVGLILLYQNSFGRWDTWAYAWGLIVVAVGVGIFIKGFWDDNAGSRRAGLIVAFAGLVLFLVFGTVFGLGLGLFQRFAGLLWPLVLIGLGALLILRRLLDPRHASSDAAGPGAYPEIEAGPKEETNDLSR